MKMANMTCLEALRSTYVDAYGSDRWYTCADLHYDLHAKRGFLLCSTGVSVSAVSADAPVAASFGGGEGRT